MQTYFILKENGLVLNDWQDKFIFEILPGKNAAYLWKKHNISMISVCFHKYRTVMNVR